MARIAAPARAIRLLKFDASGQLVKAFGAGMIVFAHGIYVDQEDNVWVTDGDSADGKGHQVIKFSPEGKIMMTLGRAGVPGDGPDTFNQPNDVVVAPNRDIFVANGHTPNKGNARLVKFTKDGTFIKQMGRARIGARPVRGSALARSRFPGASLRSRPRQQSNSDFRLGRKLHRPVEAIQPAQRDIHRS